MARRWLVFGSIVLVLATAVALAGCQSSTRHDPPADAVEVPDLVGKQYRPVQELLAGRDLRWRFVGAERIWSKPPPSNMWSTGDDDFVTEQSPKAGTKVPPRSVIELRTSCTMGKLPPGSVCID
jgi:beta-lactam-binding protein with PASTA domain